MTAIAFQKPIISTVDSDFLEKFILMLCDIFKSFVNGYMRLFCVQGTFSALSWYCRASRFLLRNATGITVCGFADISR